MMPKAAQLAWSDALSVGYPAMDDTHEEFVALVRAMQAADDDAFAASVDAFLEHAVAHFAQENEWMRATGFPAANCHIDEHEAVLGSVREVSKHLRAGGAVGPCRALAESLAGWFPGHTDYMDASLAQWMTRLRFGGKPVVLKRDLRRSGQDC